MLTEVKCKICFERASLHGNKHYAWILHHMREKHPEEWKEIVKARELRKEIYNDIVDKYGVSAASILFY